MTNEKLVLYGSLLYYNSDKLYCQSDISEEEEKQLWQNLADSLGFKKNITPEIIRNSSNIHSLRDKNINGEKLEEALINIINSGNWKSKNTINQTSLIDKTWQKIKKELNFSLKSKKPKMH
jgi:hypothetical protein